MLGLISHFKKKEMGRVSDFVTVVASDDENTGRSTCGCFGVSNDRIILIFFIPKMNTQL